MNLDSYIERLLQSEDCFSIPGLGGFISQYTGAYLHPVTHKFMPPSRKVVFNSQLENHEQNLINLVSIGENLPKSGAEQVVNTYTSSIFEKLEGYGFYEIKNIGRFYYNPAKELEFESFNQGTFLEESFGLPELLYKPIEREFMKNRPASQSADSSNETTEKSQNSGSKVIWAILPLVVILGIGAVMYGTKDSNVSFAKFLSFSSPKGELTGENLEVEENLVEDGTIIDTVEEEFTVEIGSSEEFSDKGPNLVADENNLVVSEAVEKEPANLVVEEKAISVPSGSFSIIIGSFENKINADKLHDKITCEGHDVNIIEPDASSRFYRVAVASFNNSDEAFNRLNEFQQRFGPGAWVMKNR